MRPCRVSLKRAGSFASLSVQAIVAAAEDNHEAVCTKVASLAVGRKSGQNCGAGDMLQSKLAGAKAIACQVKSRPFTSAMGYNTIRQHNGCSFGLHLMVMHGHTWEGRSATLK